MTTNEKKSKIKQFNTIDKFRLFSKNEFYEPNKFKFSLESESGLSPLYIFTKALQILIDKVDALLEFNSDKIKISKSELNDIHNILIHEETHTIGNLLQSLIFNESQYISIVFATRSWLPSPVYQIPASRSWLPDPGCQILAATSWLRDPGY